MNSQILEPVEWNFDSKKIDENRYELIFTADIDPNWAIYSKTVDEGGPVATTFYFSDNNIRKTNKSRSLYSVKLITNTQNLPLLKNDTGDIIEYIDDIEIYKKKKKKYTFWDLIGK